MMPVQYLKKTVRYVKAHGISGFLLLLAMLLSRKFHRLLDYGYEWRFGIRTSRMPPAEEFNISNPQNHTYAPSNYRSLFKAFRRLNIRPGQDVFVDFGSGMGRVVVVAATHPFRKVIGVELSTDLNEQAKRNLARAKVRFSCPDIELLTADATCFRIPPAATIFFLYNPFSGAVLEKVLENIRQSLAESPRRLTLVFKNTQHFESYLARSDWMVARQEFHDFLGHPVLVCENRELDGRAQGSVRSRN